MSLSKKRAVLSYMDIIDLIKHCKFEKIPFYENIKEIVKLTPLRGIVEQCTLVIIDRPRDMVEQEFLLRMTVDQINTIALNCDISNPKQKYLYQFQIRICQIGLGCSEVTDEFPDKLFIRVGTKTWSYTVPDKQFKKKKFGHPIYCTEEIKLCPYVTNSIKINWVPNGKHYAIEMNIVKKISADTLIEKLLGKEGRSSEDTKNEIINKLTDVDPDLATTSNHFSLLCPLTKTRMNLPAKSINCDHIKCFDASTFIKLNELNVTWLCPICRVSCLYDEIKVENYFLEIVKSSRLEDGDSEIVIHNDGSWEKVLNTLNTLVTEVKHIDFMDLDSDDEESIEPKKESRAEYSKLSEFIDLVDEDDEPPKKKLNLKIMIK
ncbi:E3 SUMO-protein ligase PIAS1-like [Aphis gossypii]|uniref:SP-RING-type domain-containing protein n=1 Tax=Aphis gossypii TaxID=80765 RepID=A0A9P0JAB6_APHGO|nr:E3 SUMO-protein ligase PIAS1-like [Aphis gossypii]XP_050063719.1 E3 SUMO-protein ligase PIAS1-like [Aphis gossypii]CAH1733336.1 unnamed protein product [Aphis gossypii]